MEGLDLKSLFARSFDGRRVLVTGHTGFKGSWLALWLRELGADVAGLALDPEAQPNHWDALSLGLAHDYRVDLRDAAAVAQAVAAVQPEFVFHLAAQPLVRRGYAEPVATFGTNVLGLVHLLEAVRRCDSVRVVVNATTDKVYRQHGRAGGFREDDALGGSDPYSTSKACAELVTDCYRHSYFTPTAAGGSAPALYTARAGNVVGGGDWSQDRLVPDVVRAALAGTAVHLRNRDATRPWQHVLEPLAGYLRIAQLARAGTLASTAWNFGPGADQSLSVGEMVERLRRHWPDLAVQDADGPHPPEAQALALSSERAGEELGWQPVWNADQTLQHTADWYREFHSRGRLRSRHDLQEYVAAARVAGLEWAA